MCALNCSPAGVLTSTRQGFRSPLHIGGLTICPTLLLEMDKLTDEVHVEEAFKQDIPKVVVDEKKPSSGGR